jgi:hypothetical protein
MFQISPLSIGQLDRHDYSLVFKNSTGIIAKYNVTYITAAIISNNLSTFTVEETVSSFITTRSGNT